MWLPWLRARRQQMALREVVEQQRRMLTKEQVAEQSALIIAQIEQMSAFREAQTVLIYKTFLLPVTHRHSMEVRPYDGEDMLRKGRFGIPEPQTPTYRGPIDLIFVPGVVFDHHCHRIGRGGGYYDKFLSKHLRSKKIGVCYTFQLKKHTIPHRWGDRKMDRVVTPQLSIG